MSNNEKTFTHYRIGDFAKYLGVTSDFLKHYEEAGLIDVVQRASGYRYYPFNQAARVIEYMRLRNYGVTGEGDERRSHGKFRGRCRIPR